MPLSIIVRVVSQVYEKCIFYSAENPESEEEAMLCNVILSRYENLRKRIVNGGCDTDVGLKSIEDSLRDIIVYEQQYQNLISVCLCEELSEELSQEPSQELSQELSQEPTRCSGDDCREYGYLVKVMPAIAAAANTQCRDETDILNVSVNFNLSYAEFKNNIISTEDHDNDINVTYEDHDADDVDDIYS